MAQHHFPNVTLALTLPISCHICLGKVRQPVICVNHHVFCSTCIEMWLKTASRCPACRVPITEENPCREIIGGTNESEPSESYTVKRRLRKTRGELLLKEYEDEIEGLIKENEDLKTTNQQLESQLKTVLDPCMISASQRDDKNIDLGVLEEWANKLRAATDRYCEVKEEMARLKEANKTLRSQNIELVQESMRLKAEVASRSPQKFGRYTVAALEAKIHQYERDMDHLRRALERSDQYIEDLESRVVDGDNERPSDRREPPRLSPASQSESGEAGPGASAAKRSIAAMRRSLSDMETASVCTDLEGESQTLPCDGDSFLLVTSLGLAVPDQRLFGGTLSSQGDKDTTGSTSDSFSPLTPASAFRSLSLKSHDKKLGCKPVTYLRKLSFEGCAGTSDAGENDSSHFSKLQRSPSPASLLNAGPSQPKAVFWGAWHGSKSTRLTSTSPTEDQQPTPSHSERNLTAGPGSPDQADNVHMSSEASMDAAYMDKISELDSMMLEGESSSSRGSQLSLASVRSADFNATLVPEPNSCDDASPERVAGGEATERRPSSPSEEAGEEDGVAGSVVKATSSPVRGSGYPSVVDGALGPGRAAEPSQTDEQSFDPLFDPPLDNKEGPSGSETPAGHASSCSSSSCSSSCGCPRKPGNTVRDKHTVTPSKRKSHSPFNITSTSKLSKYI